jgi:hypothetical protein
MISIRFRIKNEYGNPLKKIFNNISINNYCWKIEFSEIYNVDKGNLSQKIFDKELMTGQEFQFDVNREVYYMIFLTAIAFENIENVVSVNNYLEFIQSKAKIAFVCTDNEYIEVYSKDELILKEMIKNCKENEFTDIEIINNEKDVMNKFI